MLTVLGEPLLAGIHLADPWRLSLQATFPALRAPVRRTQPGAQAPAGIAHLRGSPFASLEGGVQQLVDALRARLDGCLEVSAPVTSIVPDAGGYRVHLRCGGREPLSVAAVAVTTPAATAANLVRTANPGLAELLAGAEAASSAIVTLGYRDPRVALPLAGSGFLVPRDENSRLLACTWSSAKWAGRAPAGGVLLRGFLGGWRQPEVLALRDGELIELLQDELSVALGRSFARSVQPAVSLVHRWPAGTPLYRVGHADWLAGVRAACAASPGLWLAGAPYDGVGIPDCIRQARETAAAVAARSPPPSACSPTASCCVRPAPWSVTNATCRAPSSTTGARSRPAGSTCSEAAPACSTTRCASSATATLPPGGALALCGCARTSRARASGCATAR